MHFLLMSVLLVSLAQEPNEAEKLFRASEKKLAEADSAQITVKGAMKTAKGEITVNGTVLITKGNKSRSDLTVEHPVGRYKLASVSDGTKTKTKMEMSEGDKADQGRIQDTPKNANALLAGVASRAGLLTGTFMVIRGGPNKPGELDDMITVADFAMGEKEKIGDRQAQRIDFKLTISAGAKKDTFSAHVWLDTETNMPLKRIVSAKKGTEDEQITETYDIRLNAKIEASKFEVPK